MASRNGTSGRVSPATRNGRHGGAVADPAAATPTPGHAPGAGAERRRRRSPRPSSGAAARRVGCLAELLPAGGERRRLRRLATLVGHGGRGRRDRDRLAAAAAEWLERVAALPSGADRWVASEAGAWAVARAQRAAERRGARGERPPRRSESSPLVDRLLAVIEPAVAAVGTGDTAAAACLLVVAALFPDDDRCRGLESQAREAVEAEVDRLVAPDGGLGPEAADSATRVAAVARWAGILSAVRAVGGDQPWNGRTRSRFRSACETALMLLGPPGTRPGTDAVDERARATLLATIEEHGRRRARVTARHLRQGAGDDARLLRRERGMAEGCQAVIRSGWDAADLRLFLDWRGACPWLEVAVGRRLLVAGPWSALPSRGGLSIEADGPWRLSSCEPCRHGTFLEIVQPLLGGGEVQRQVVVLAADRIVLLADAVVLPTAAGPLSLETRLSLPDGVTVAAPTETTERLLGDRRPRCAVLPLALAEWSAARGAGSLDAIAPAGGAPGGLRLRQVGAGPRLYAPLWLDCDPRRSRGALTWRQLTVADTRRILDRHEAAGFRVQAGLDQWLVYRALDEPRNRTLLGCNVACEFVLGRIKPRGRIGRSIEIE